MGGSLTYSYKVDKFNLIWAKFNIISLSSNYIPVSDDRNESSKVILVMLALTFMKPRSNVTFKSLKLLKYFKPFINGTVKFYAKLLKNA